jgi:hypothetical protein
MKLGGNLFVMDGVKHDYPFMQAITCLKNLCNEVVVVCIKTEDQTFEIVKSIPDIKVIEIDKSQWEALSNLGSERLAFFTNIGLTALEQNGCDWVFNLQADEIIHEDSFDNIYNAMLDNRNDSYIDGFFSVRLNLWSSPHYYLSDPKNGQPCSTEVIRLTKAHCRAVGDAESLSAQCVDFAGLIYHMGFVRDKKVHPAKIKHMQEEVFKMDSDKKLVGMEEFNAFAWHDVDDLEMIPYPLPQLIKQWAYNRF